MMELNAFAGQYADAMAQSTGLLVCITDRDQVVAAAGGAKEDFFKTDQPGAGACDPGTHRHPGRKKGPKLHACNRR